VSRLPLIFSILATLIFFATSEASATNQTEKYPVIFVIRSESCQKMIQYHIKSSCPTDDLIMKYDTSDQHISGKFIVKNGITVRTEPQIKNHYQFYTKETVCIDCNGNLALPDLFKTIILESHDFTYIDKYATVGNNKWQSFNDRHMAGCNTATIAYSDALFNDTISYLESNCTRTSFNGTTNHVIQDQPWSWNNPFSSIHQQNLVSSIKGIGNCITKQCDVKDPYKKAGY